jgi:transposase-like protein
MPRKGYSISQKLSMVRTLETRCGHDDSLRSVAGQLGVDPSQLRRWKSQKTSLRHSSNAAMAPTRVSLTNLQLQLL